MSRIYTKTGDGGTTSLIGGERVSKADPRVEAYGTVDELAAHLALLGDMMAGAAGCGEMVAAIEETQKDIMTVEALLAVGRGGRNVSSTERRSSPQAVEVSREEDNADGESGYAEKNAVLLPESAVERLEAEIDAMGEGLPPLTGFVLPGGHPVVSQCHVCRTVCRRAERASIRADEEFGVPDVAIRFLNRLSDWLFVAGRRIAVVFHIKETYWTP